MIQTLLRFSLPRDFDGELQNSRSGKELLVAGAQSGGFQPVAPGDA